VLALVVVAMMRPPLLLVPVPVLVLVPELEPLLLLDELEVISPLYRSSAALSIEVDPSKVNLVSYHDSSAAPRPGRG
jgi:hypothetical protein